MGILHIGIDPGVSGAICALDPDNSNEVRFFDTPTLSVKVGKNVKNVLDVYQMVEILKIFTAGREKKTLVTIEKVQAMPDAGTGAKMGMRSAFSFGMGFGMWLGILAALELPHQQVHPATWKAAVMAGMGKEKDASRQRAMQLYPRAAKDLNLKKHHGRADALMLARYGWLTYGGVKKEEPESMGLFA